MPDVDAILGLSWLRVWKGADHAAARAGSRHSAPPIARTPKWWDVVISPMLGSDGKPERFVSVGRDITDRRLAEATRREQEAELRLVADALPVPGIQVLTKPFAMDLLGNRIRLLIEGA